MEIFHFCLASTLGTGSFSEEVMKSSANKGVLGGGEEVLFTVVVIVK